MKEKFQDKGESLQNHVKWTGSIKGRNPLTKPKKQTRKISVLMQQILLKESDKTKIKKKNIYN